MLLVVEKEIPAGLLPVALHGFELDIDLAMAICAKPDSSQRISGADRSITRIAETDVEEFVELCVRPPAIHRYGASMARRVHALAHHVLEHYDGKADKIWKSGKPDAKEVLRRVKALPGYGDQKARIFVALLGKQLGVTPEGWREAAGAYGEEGSRRSIADVTGAETLAEVRAFKKAAKAVAKS
jgi:uncharacterized HhH-GPD family protein